MRAVVLTGAGGVEVLALSSVPDPEPSPDEVLVRVRATALNRVDLLQRRGLYPAPAGAPAHIPGLEFAGEVERCGARVGTWGPGDRVMGILGGGAHAERVVVHERLCLAVPPALDWAQAAAVPEAFLTADDALFRQGGLMAGEWLLLHAAAGGVGTATAQIASASGARVIGLSRSADKRARLAALGVAHALDPTGPELAGEVASLTGGAGVDLVVSMMGAPSLRADLETLRPRGRLVVVGLLGGAVGPIDLGLVLRRRLTIVGTTLRARALEEKIEVVQDFARRMLPLLASGRMRAVVDRVLPLERIAEAHAALERNETFGKIVLSVA